MRRSNTAWTAANDARWRAERPQIDREHNAFAILKAVIDRAVRIGAGLLRED
jgi:hypothetical protein